MVVGADFFKVMTELEIELVEYVKENCLDDIRSVMSSLNHKYSSTRFPLIINGIIDIVEINHKTMDIALKYRYSKKGFDLGCGTAMSNPEDIEERSVSLNSIKELL